LAGTIALKPNFVLFILSAVGTISINFLERITYDPSPKSFYSGSQARKHQDLIFKDLKIRTPAFLRQQADSKIDSALKSNLLSQRQKDL